jgi:hypothetical protein
MRQESLAPAAGASDSSGSTSLEFQSEQPDSSGSTSLEFQREQPYSLQASLGFQTGQPPDLPGSDQEIVCSVSSSVGFERRASGGEHQQGFVLQHEQELTQLSKEQVLSLRVFVYLMAS